MGYYANASGEINFKTVLDKEAFEAVRDELEQAFCYVGGVQSGANGKTSFDVNYEGNYHDDCVYCALDNITEQFPVESGSIIFCGEADDHWKIYYDDGRWKEENGTVVFDSDIKKDEITGANIRYDNGKTKVLEFNGQVVVKFATNIGVISVSFDPEDKYESDAVSVGLEPTKYPTDYVDLFYGHVMTPEDAKRFGADETAIGLYLYEDPSTEDSSYSSYITDNDLNDAIKECYKEGVET